MTAESPGLDSCDEQDSSMPEECDAGLSVALSPSRGFQNDVRANAVADSAGDAGTGADRTSGASSSCNELQDLEHLVKERSAELLAAQRQLLISEKLASVGQLAAGIAHEINTPIQYIGDNLQALSEYFDDLLSVIHKYREVVALARSGEATPEAFDALGAVEEEHDLEYILNDAPNAVAQGLEGVKRVVHIVRAMKDFSHVNRSELSITDINHVLESTLTVARNEYKYVADVETDFGELPQIECYVSDLNQVFLNLLVNAAHAIADTGKRGTITIKTRARGDDVEVRITDTGTGIPEEIRDKIFDPFFTTKEVGQGTGQGLNIAHQIVVGKHGGTLSLETEVGKGTTFCLRIPIQAVAPATPDEKDE